MLVDMLRKPPYVLSTLLSPLPLGAHIRVMGHTYMHVPHLPFPSERR